MTHTLTTIEVQGQQESVYEVYADESREQTIAYALEESTARLIAAAPELLEALDNLAEHIDSKSGDFTMRAHFLKEAFAAIAKARGEA